MSTPVEGTRPFLKVSVVWHPAFEEGPALGRLVFDHFRRDAFSNVSGGTGIPVAYWSQSIDDGQIVPTVALEDTEMTSVIVFVDNNLTSDVAWVDWLRELIRKTGDIGLATRVIPVAIDASAIRSGIPVQALRWDHWEHLAPLTRQRRLLSDLTYQLCRMLRLYAEHLVRPMDTEEKLLAYVKKVEIFLSHSKQDLYGQKIAKQIRDYLADHGDFETFFDVLDIPIGLQFDAVLLIKIKVSAVVAIHTDSYSSREWCRREIIEAKRWNAPLVIADCISDLDDRGFPYLGNVPVVRMDPTADDRIDVVVFHLLNEVLKDLLWRCWVQSRKKPAKEVSFVPRPPELIMLANVNRGGAAQTSTLVYPEPPIGSEEEELFAAVAPNLRLLSMLEWVAEVGK